MYSLTTSYKHDEVSQKKIVELYENINNKIISREPFGSLFYA